MMHTLPVARYSETNSLYVISLYDVEAADKARAAATATARATFFHGILSRLFKINNRVHKKS